MENFTVQICPKCKSKKFKTINDDLTIECICGTVFKDNEEILQNYITGKQSQLILNITTRQGLHKIVKEKNITVKSQGAGKPNLYLECDVKKVAAETNKQRLKTNPKLKKKIEKKTAIIEKKKTIIKDTKKKGILNDNPLNEVGQEVFNELREDLIENGTFEDKDVSLLQAYCVSYQKYINAINQSANKMDLTQDDFGNEKPHPYFLIADKCLAQMVKISNLLGIGAKSRVTLEIKKAKNKNVFEMLSEKDDF